MERFKCIGALVLDLDGTIVDSFPGHVESWTRTIERFGGSADREEIRLQMGKSSHDISRALLGEIDFGELERASRTKDEIYYDIIPDFLEVIDGADRTLRELKERGYMISIASSNPLKVIERSLRVVGLREVVDEIASQEEVAKGKPEPDIFLLARSKLGVTSDDCTVVGDTSFDMEAARRAGMFAIGFTGGVQGREELEAANPDLVITDITDLLHLLPEEVP